MAEVRAGRRNGTTALADRSNSSASCDNRELRSRGCPTRVFRQHQLTTNSDRHRTTTQNSAAPVRQKFHALQPSGVMLLFRQLRQPCPHIAQRPSNRQPTGIQANAPRRDREGNRCQVRRCCSRTRFGTQRSSEDSSFKPTEGSKLPMKVKRRRLHPCRWRTRRAKSQIKRRCAMVSAGQAQFTGHGPGQHASAPRSLARGAGAVYLCHFALRSQPVFPIMAGREVAPLRFSSKPTCEIRIWRSVPLGEPATRLPAATRLSTRACVAPAVRNAELSFRDMGSITFPKSHLMPLTVYLIRALRHSVLLW